MMPTIRSENPIAPSEDPEPGQHRGRHRQHAEHPQHGHAAKPGDEEVRLPPDRHVPDGVQRDLQRVRHPHAGPQRGDDPHGERRPRSPSPTRCSRGSGRRSPGTARARSRRSRPGARVAAQDHPEHGREHHEQREQREERVVGDERGEVPRLVLAELLRDGEGEPQPRVPALVLVDPFEDFGGTVRPSSAGYPWSATGNEARKGGGGSRGIIRRTWIEPRTFASSSPPATRSCAPRCATSSGSFRSCATRPPAWACSCGSGRSRAACARDGGEPVYQTTSVLKAFAFIDELSGPGRLRLRRRPRGPRGPGRDPSREGVRPGRRPRTHRDPHRPASDPAAGAVGTGPALEARAARARGADGDGPRDIEHLAARGTRVATWRTTTSPAWSRPCAA